MTERQLGKVVIAGMGLWLLLQSIAYFASLLNIWMSSGFREDWIGNAAAYGITGGCGAIVVALRERLARVLFQDAALTALSKSADMVAALLAILGIYFAVTALVALLGFEGNRWLEVREMTKKAHGSLFDFVTPARPPAEARIRAWSQIAIGISLFLGSRGLARIWHGLRQAGKDRP